MEYACTAYLHESVIRLPIWGNISRRIANTLASVGVHDFKAEAKYVTKVGEGMADHEDYPGWEIIAWGEQALAPPD